MNAMTTPATATERTSPDHYGDLYGRDSYAQVTETDQELWAFVEGAELPVLMTALAAALKDMSLLEPDLSPPLPPMGATTQPHGGLKEDQVARGRQIAFEALRRLRDEDIRTVDELPPEQADYILDWFTGGRTSSDPSWAGEMHHELLISPPDRKSVV